MISQEELSRAKQKALRRRGNPFLLRRRLSRPMEFCFRFELPGGSDWKRRLIRRTDKAVVDAILRHDDQLEIHHQDQMGEQGAWVVYRKIQLGPCEAEDYLRFQFVLPHPPGGWVVRELQERDGWYKQNLDKDRAADLAIQAREARKAKLADDKEREIAASREEAAKDILAAKRGKVSILNS